MKQAKQLMASANIPDNKTNNERAGWDLGAPGGWR